MTGPSRDWMTKNEVEQLIREILDEQNEPPYRGGWFTASLRNHIGGGVRRWRDPQTGIVWSSALKIVKHCDLRGFDQTYTNVQWEDDEPAKTRWPPAGLPVLVQWFEGGTWWYAESDGRGEFTRTIDDSPRPAYAWRYIPANWSNAPAAAEQWVVTSLGEQLWMFESWEVGDEIGVTNCTIVHTEDRP